MQHADELAKGARGAGNHSEHKLRACVAIVDEDYLSFAKKGGLVSTQVHLQKARAHKRSLER